MNGNRLYVGHVINVHDSLNFDIDIFLDAEAQQVCANVISDNYIYQDLDMSNPLLEKPQIKTGHAYRCRLQGLAHQGVKQEPAARKANFKVFESRVHSAVYRKKQKPLPRFYKDAHLTMIRLVDRCNGWLLVRIHNIDVYNRLIVSLYDPITKQDLRLVLLSKYPKFFLQYDENRQDT